MTTAEIEQLYIAHAEDFRELLGRRQLVAELDDGVCLSLHTTCDGDIIWQFLGPPLAGSELPSALAVAAMSGVWPARLEKEYGVGLCDDGRVLREQENVFTYLCYDGTWSLDPEQAVQFQNGYEAICAAVKALAAEKRDHIPDATKKLQADHIARARKKVPTIEDLAKRVEELENRLDGVDLERLATGAD